MNGDLKKIVKQGKNPNNTKLKKAWFKLNDSYTKAFGMDLSVKKLLELRKQYALNMASYLETGDKAYQMEYQLLKVDIQNENNVGKKDKARFLDIIVAVEKFYGFQLDLNKTTVEQFYSYLKKMKEDNQQNKRFKTE